MNVVGSSEVNRFNPRPLQNLQGGRGFGIRYPSPFFDIAQQFLPENVHQLHTWCRYYFLTNPIINAACAKMAEYPVTRLIYDTEDEALQKHCHALEKRLRLRQFQVEIGLDYFVYGNGFASIWFPMIKWIRCKKCGQRYRAEKHRSRYTWKNQKFFLKCGCGHQDYADQVDTFPKSPRDIRLIRWNPENIEIKHNEINGMSKYYYKLPRRIVNDIKIGDPDTIENLPLEFLEAARKSRALLFGTDNFYHLKRPTIAQKDQGWGTPLIFSLLKEAFNMQVMKKAQETLLLEHVVPLRVVYPGPSTGGNDAPYGSYNLSNWKAKISAELNIWKRDHNYIPILPVNVGFQQWGGTAKALILHQEFRLAAEQMLAGAGIPVEFIFGGLQWTGTNTSLRALENMFEGYNGQRHELINDFILGKIFSHMEWPKVNARFDRFKMADDLQRSMFYLQMNQAQKISDRRFLEEVGEDFDKETRRMGEELKRQLSTNRKMQVATADIQGEAQLRQGRYQAKAMELQAAAQMEGQMAGQLEAQEMQQQEGGAPQPGAGQDPGQGQPQPQQGEAPNESRMPVAMSDMQSPLQQGAGGVDLRFVAQKAMGYLNTIEQEKGPDAKAQAMAQMQTENPELYRLVIQLQQSEGGEQTNPQDPMKAPLPSSPQKDVSRAIG